MYPRLSPAQAGNLGHAATDASASASTLARAVSPQSSSTGRKRDCEAAGLPTLTGRWQMSQIPRGFPVENPPDSPPANVWPIIVAPENLASEEPASPTSRAPTSPFSSPARPLLPGADTSPSFRSPVRTTADIGIFTAGPDLMELDPAARDLLLTKLNRPDLAALAAQLNSQVGASHWTFTGSVALQIHSMVRTGTPGCLSVDAGVELDPLSHALFSNNFRNETADNALQAVHGENSGKHDRYSFDQQLNVDILKVKRQDQKRPGRRQIISGIPVLTLDSLRLCKESDLEDSRPAIKNKARQDLAQIVHLLQIPLPAQDQGI